MKSFNLLNQLLSNIKITTPASSSSSSSNIINRMPSKIKSWLKSNLIKDYPNTEHRSQLVKILFHVPDGSSSNDRIVEPIPLDIISMVNVVSNVVPNLLLLDNNDEENDEVCMLFIYICVCM